MAITWYHDISQFHKHNNKKKMTRTSIGWEVIKWPPRHQDHQSFNTRHLHTAKSDEKGVFSMIIHDLQPWYIIAVSFIYIIYNNIILILYWYHIDIIMISDRYHWCHATFIQSLTQSWPCDASSGSLAGTWAKSRQRSFPKRTTWMCAAPPRSWCLYWQDWQCIQLRYGCYHLKQNFWPASAATGMKFNKL